MKKIEAVIKPAIMDEVYAALGIACQHSTLDETKGRGTQKGVDLGFREKRYRTALAMTVIRVKERRTRRRRTDRGNVEIAFVPKTRIDVVGRDWDVRAVMDIIAEAASTGTVGGSRYS